MNKRCALLCACALAALAMTGCNDSIKWSDAPVCGNGVIENGEICDAVVPNGVNCNYYSSAIKWASGKPGCSANCELTQGTCLASNVQNTCGNGILDVGEACDGSVFADSSVSCASLLGTGATGSLSCVGCAVSTSTCVPSSTCGNGIVDAGEVCDGSNFGGMSCANFAGENATGNLSCEKCVLDSTGCIPAVVEPACGDGVVSGSEQCDGTNLNGKTCADFAGPGATGSLACNGCVIDSTACVPAQDSCGDNVKSSSEECDGSDFGGKSCADYKGPGATGSLSCNACIINSDDCKEAVVTEKCGNGTIDTADGEECDGTNLGTATCASVLNDTHATGSLSCVKCRLDKSGCTIPPYCGDGVINGSEQCEGTNLNNKTCADYEGTGATGTLNCNVSDCTINASNCKPAEPTAQCNDGKLDDNNEECDGNQFMLNVTTCAEYSNTYISGNLKCNDNCTIDDSLCVLKCGDGVVQSDEECDTDKFDPDVDTCNDWIPGTSGTLTCKNTCEVDYSDCKVRCNDGVLAINKEMCDGDIFDTELVDTLECAEYDPNSFSSGKLKCNATCDDVDTSDCVPKSTTPSCGDGILNGTEECEMVNGSAVYKDNATCSSVLGAGYTGNLSCNSCQIVTTACVAPAPSCGDGILNGTEECEMVNGSAVYKDNATCSSVLGVAATGNLSCNNCKIDSKACSASASGTLIISEYLHDGNNRALELYNASSSSIDLSKCQFDYYMNGSKTFSKSDKLSGTLAASAITVLCSDDLKKSKNGSACNTSFSKMTGDFNGNDAIVLRCNNTVIDSLGKVGDDSDWAKNKTLTRQCSIVSGDTTIDDAFNIADEWQSYNKGTYTYLGKHCN